MDRAREESSGGVSTGLESVGPRGGTPVPSANHNWAQKAVLTIGGSSVPVLPPPWTPRTTIKKKEKGQRKNRMGIERALRVAHSGSIH